MVGKKPLQVTPCSLFSLETELEKINRALIAYEHMTPAELLKFEILTKTILLKKSGISPLVANEHGLFTPVIENRIKRIRTLYQKEVLLRKLNDLHDDLHTKYKNNETTYPYNQVHYHLTKAEAMISDLIQFNIAYRDFEKMIEKVYSDIDKIKANAKKIKVKQKIENTIISTIEKLKETYPSLFYLNINYLSELTFLSTFTISKFFTENPEHKAEFELIKLKLNLLYLKDEITEEIYTIRKNWKTATYFPYITNDFLEKLNNYKRKCGKQGYVDPEFLALDAEYRELLQNYKENRFRNYSLFYPD